MPKVRGDIIKLESEICLNSVNEAGNELLNFQKNNTFEVTISIKSRTYD